MFPQASRSIPKPIYKYPPLSLPTSILPPNWQMTFCTTQGRDTRGGLKINKINLKLRTSIMHHMIVAMQPISHQVLANPSQAVVWDQIQRYNILVDMFVLPPFKVRKNKQPVWSCSCPFHLHQSIHKLTSFFRRAARVNFTALVALEKPCTLTR